MTYFDYSLKSKTLLRIIKDLSIRRRKVNIDSDEFVEIIRTIKQEGGYNWGGWRNIHQKQIPYGFQVPRAIAILQLLFIISSKQKL